MNILLIHPEFPETFWSMKHALKFIQRSASQPPLGLLTVAALLPADWNKRLVDLNVRPLTPGDLAWADYAFLGGMVVQQDSARRVIARCRSAGLPIVAGGPLFTTEHDQRQVLYRTSATRADSVLDGAATRIAALFHDVER